MAERHAPGPWAANLLTVVDAHGYPVAKIKRCMTVKGVNEALERDLRTLALVVAAPKLLAALREACDVLEPLDPEWRVEIDRWADVIAEAEGRRP